MELKPNTKLYDPLGKKYGTVKTKETSVFLKILHLWQIIKQTNKCTLPPTKMAENGI